MANFPVQGQKPWGATLKAYIEALPTDPGPFKDALTSLLSGKAPTTHTHVSTQVTDFAEAVQDAVAAMLVSGANVTLAYDDTAGTVQITAAGGDAEVMRDTVGAALVGTTGVGIAVNDAADTITFSISGLTISQVTGLQAQLDSLAATTGLAVVTYAGSLGAARPAATVVVWEGFPTQPTNMVDGDLWLSAAGGAFLTGTAAPTGTDGNDGDVYLRTSTWMIYGPKASGSWPAGTSLIGANGTNGTNGTNGRGITSIARTSGTGAAGTTDTYTITYSDSTTSTFTVTNGADGTGGGSSLTVQDEGGALATAATALNFVGAGVTATGTGATKTITIPGGGGGAATSPAPRYTDPTGTVRATHDRALVAMSAATLTSGTLYMMAVNLYAGDVLSAATVKSIAGFSGGTHSWAVLCDASRVVLAASPDDTSASLGANSTRTFTFGSAYTVLTSGLYYVGIMVAATSPTLIQANGLSTQQTNLPPIISGTSNTAQTTPLAVGASANALSAGNSPVYVWLT